MPLGEFQRVPRKGDLILPSKRAAEASMATSAMGIPGAFYAWLDEGKSKVSVNQQIIVPWDMPGLVISVSHPRSPGAGPKAQVLFPVGMVRVALTRIEVVE